MTRAGRAKAARTALRLLEAHAWSIDMIAIVCKVSSRTVYRWKAGQAPHPEAFAHLSRIYRSLVKEIKCDPT